MERVGIETGGEHFAKKACFHQFCRECLSAWVRERLKSMAKVISCPHDGCKFNMYPDDVGRVTSHEEGIRFLEYSRGDFKLRLRNEDPSFKKWAAKNAKACPKCKVLLIRSDGCDSMYCTCGTSFCYRCQFEDCRCYSMQCIYCPGKFEHATEDCPFGPFCTFCVARGHMLAQCSRAPTCASCMQKGHKKHTCKTVCNFCHQPGHARITCAKHKEHLAASRERTKACFRCGQMGHIAAKCTNEYVHRDRREDRRIDEELSAMRAVSSAKFSGQETRAPVVVPTLRQPAPVNVVLETPLSRVDFPPMSKVIAADGEGDGDWRIVVKRR